MIYVQYYFLKNFLQKNNKLLHNEKIKMKIINIIMTWASDLKIRQSAELHQGLTV